MRLAKPRRSPRRVGGCGLRLPRWRRCLLAAPLTPSAQQAPSVHLVDVTKQAGITFTHNNGAFGKKYLPETLGSGAAFLDYDNDGWQDLLLVNGTNWPGQPHATSRLSLYRNNGNGTFENVTAAAGLNIDLYGMGVAVADYDNDGFQDILITAVGQNHLFHNTGHGTFVDVTNQSGLGQRPGFSTSALWFDYDRDGLLDLLICNYVRWTPETDVYCSVDGKQKWYCTPGSVSRHDVLAVPQQGQRHVRGRDREGGAVRHDVEVARRDDDRLRPRSVAGRVHRQRHAAEQALSQQRQRHVHRARAAGGPGVQRGRPRARGHGRGRCRRRQLGPHDGRRHQLLRRDARALPARRRRSVRRCGAAHGRRPRDAADARLRLFLLRRGSRRAARSARRERPHRRDDLVDCRTRELRRAAAPVPQ